MNKNNKGMALIITLVLSFVAVVFVAGLLYFLNSSTRISGTYKRYNSALEASRGGAEYIMNQIYAGSLSGLCSPCTKGTSLNLGTFNNINNYQLSAVLLADPYIDNGTYEEIYAVKITANSTSTNDKAEIEFVFKIY